jgi:hypothetical protein
MPFSWQERQALTAKLERQGWRIQAGVLWSPTMTADEPSQDVTEQYRACYRGVVAAERRPGGAFTVGVKAGGAGRPARAGRGRGGQRAAGVAAEVPS